MVNDKPAAPTDPSPTDPSMAPVRSSTVRQNIPLLSLLGRILLSAIFLIAGVGKFANWGASLATLTDHHVPVAPLVLFVAALIEIVGGLSILFGVKARWGALVLFLYLIPVSLVMHNFWDFSAMDRQMQLVNFLKNLAIMGGLFQIIAFGPGSISVDHSSYHRGRILDEKDSTVRLRRVS